MLDQISVGMTEFNAPLWVVLSVSPPESSLCFCLCGVRRVLVSRPGLVSVCRWDHVKFHPALWPANILCGRSKRKMLRNPTNHRSKTTRQIVFKAKSGSPLALRWTFFYSYYDWVGVRQQEQLLNNDPVQNPKKIITAVHAVCDRRN